ncbi:50S ribosomal protein L10 [Candidatus Acetothermia bacterium]|nr:50S ribosomal protein L10 [Candidatus Acetothermia bacterium]MBI3659659.1 50S ribosomal protein L10 [Candidatus Acetothermia bacterium]
MPNPEKEQAVAVLEERFKKSKSLVFASFQGLSSAQIVEMRREFKKNKLEYYVVKNTLANIAAERAGIKDTENFFKGPTGVCIAYDEPALAFKLAHQISKKFEKYKIKGGVFEGEVVPLQEVESLAALPTRPELLARLAGAFQSPIQQLASVLNAIIQELPGVLDEVRKQKEETEKAAAASAPAAAPEAEAATPPAAGGAAS